MMFASINLVILASGLLLAQRVFGKKGDVQNLNHYIDEVLRNLRNDASLVSRFDSVKIPNMSRNGLELSYVKVKGLSSLYRHGDCILTGSENALTIIGEMGVRDLSVTASYRFKAKFFRISGEVQAQLDHIAIKFEMFATEEKFRLDSFKVVHLGNYGIKKITGFSFLLNWLAKIILNIFSSLVRGRIIQVVEGPAANALRAELHTIITSFSDI